jgi:hypothetical protein
MILNLAVVLRWRGGLAGVIRDADAIGLPNFQTFTESEQDSVVSVLTKAISL